MCKLGAKRERELPFVPTKPLFSVALIIEQTGRCLFPCEQWKGEEKKMEFLKSTVGTYNTNCSLGQQLCGLLGYLQAALPKAARECQAAGSSLTALLRARVTQPCPRQRTAKAKTAQSAFLRLFCGDVPTPDASSVYLAWH